MGSAHAPPRSVAEWAEWEKRAQNPSDDNAKLRKAQQKRDLRARDANARTGLVAVRSITSPTDSKPSKTAQPGPVETAVRAQIDMSPGAAQFPGVAAAAVTLAQQLDDRDRYGALAPQLYRQLAAALTQLGEPHRKSGGRLVAIRAMTQDMKAVGR
jgi:hypothetical protein